MMHRNSLTIEFLSDWHIGSGAGIPGSVDRQVLRDADGLPYIPGKTLTGILRDAAEFIVQHRPEDAKHVKALFGHQPESHGGDESEEAKGATVSIRPARLPESLRTHLSQLGNEPVRDALFFTQPHVQIDSETGRAKDDHLFFLELVRGGVKLTADIEVETPDDDEKTFLERVVKAVRRMGGKRRRGAGKCKASLGKWDEVAIDASSMTQEEASSGTFEEAGWTIIPLEVTLNELVQIHRETLGNIVEGLDFIPGSIMLPVIFERLKKGGVDEAALRKAVAQGNFQVSDFTPMVDDNRSYPVPNALFQQKVERKNDGSTDNQIYNRLVHTGEGLDQLRGLRTGWAVPKEGSLAYAKGDDLLALRMHNTIEDDVQRPTEKVGGVYTYEALRAGLRLGGELRIAPNGPDLTPAQINSLRGNIRLGRSKKDDYGAAGLSLSKVKPDSTPEVTPGDIALTAGAILTVYLESDALVRNESLALSGDPRDLGRVLGEQLGVTLKPMESEKGDATIASIGRVRRRESWHVGWKLPRPSLVGLQGGSVYRFKVIKEPTEKSKTTAAQLQAEGIGERRAEGFGRIILNPPFLASETLKKEEMEISWAEGDAGTMVEGDALTLLRELQSTAFRREIQRRARQVAFGDEPKFFGLDPKNGPSQATQWGSLRAAGARVGDSFVKGRFPLQQWVDRRLVEDSNNDGNDPWPKRRQDKWGKMRGEIKKLSEDENCAWKFMGPLSSPYLGKDDEDTLKSELWGFAVRALIDATCEAAIKRCQKRDDRQGADKQARTVAGQGRS